MSCLSFISVAKTLVHASLPNDDPLSSPLQTSNNSKPLIPIENNPTIPAKKLPRAQQRRKPRRPSVVEIERAIGAGRFRDTDPRELEEDKKTVFDASLLNFTGKFEAPIMKKLRETGEWVTDQTESKFRASGKRILLFVFLWIMPFWVFAFLVASGVIKLPFSSPYLDDLLM